MGVLGGKKKKGRAVAVLDADGDVDEGIWDRNPPSPQAEDRLRGQGYAVPEEQFGYADTGYGGAGEMMAGRRRGETRL